MQATLSSRSKLIDVVAPRPKADSIANRTGTEQTSRRDDFASKLTDARDRSTQTTRDSHSEPAAPVKKVESTKPCDDAGNERRGKSNSDTTDGASASSVTTAKKVKPADPADVDAAAEKFADDDAGTEQFAKPTAVASATTDPAADALAATAANAAASPPVVANETGDVAPTRSQGEKNDAIELAAAVAVATQTAPTGADIVGGEASDASAEATSPAAVDVTNLKAADPEAKSAKPVSADAGAAKTGQQNDVGVPEAGAKSPEHGSHGENAQQQPKQDDASASANPADLPEAATTEKHKASAESTFDALLAKLSPQDASQPKPAVDRLATTTAAPPEQKFAADNVDNVVKSVRTQLSGGGGELRMRLDPPELGALDVAVKMLDGRMTASFTTSNDQATQLLSHSLNQLKQSLEASGITVDRIQVRQSTSDNNAQQQPGEHGREGQSGAFDQSSGRGDQHRKDAVEKMWRKLAYGSDELDFVA